MRTIDYRSYYLGTNESHNLPQRKIRAATVRERFSSQGERMQLLPNGRGSYPGDNLSGGSGPISRTNSRVRISQLDSEQGLDRRAAREHLSQIHREYRRFAGTAGFPVRRVLHAE